MSSEGESSRDSRTEEIVKLPENLPSDILEIIGNIKQAASTSWEGKVKFFTGPVNKMLLRCGLLNVKIPGVYFNVIFLTALRRSVDV